MHHGWILDVIPSVAHGLTWNVYETKKAGIVAVHEQISPDWNWERFDFRWADDLQDYSGLHGLVAFCQTNAKDPMNLARLGRHVIPADFIFCGLLEGDAIPFHTPDQSTEIMQWFISKQVQWDDIYSKPAYSEAKEGAGPPDAYASARSAYRSQRKIIH